VKNTKTAKPTVVKPTAKQAKATAKPSAKPSAKKHTVDPERSRIARLAAYKAHTHKSFQSDRNPAERKLAVLLYAQAQRTRDHVPTTDRREALKKIAA
jgi:hypothetical protein